MMGNDFGLGGGALWIVAQEFAGATVERLAAALEQTFVGRVLDQRVLEAVVGLGGAPSTNRRSASTSLSRAALRCSSSSSATPRFAQERISEFPSHDRAHLRDFSRSAKPVQPRGERLLQGQRDGLHAALFAALEEQPRHLLDEQRHAAGPLVDSFDGFGGKGVAGRRFRRPSCDLRRSSGNERHDPVVRARGPRRSEFRAGATTTSGAFAPRSARALNRSSEVGSLEWRSSKASTRG